ncbi:ABC transporter substrate-binding protein [Micromonospora endophytica]|uniref:ABC transporter n=1 Tax=Micromonospora endophytica TaxID=515350 RepID=A0A2W2DMR6_9ACTN|nr:extracellular solute-binding protein [Micromonospora endophytica]PZG01048.1 ABC transporter [Micromonospora endophytica]RIW47910.1 extracellular solute-binding protein [Micromonospora endophytica]BCJ62281.1 sugar-binding protein [Micromonospora endophytica]
MNASITGRRGLRRWQWLPIAVATAVAVTACGSDSGSGDEDAKVDKITFWLSTSAQLDGYTDLAKAFEAKEGVSVEIVNLPYDGYQDKLRQSAQANSLPDAASVPSLDPIWMNQLQDLSQTAKNPDYKIIESLVAELDGKVLAIPSDVTAAGLFINKSLFDEAKVSYPTDPSSTWTWDEFLAAATQVRTATKAKYDLVYDNSPARIRAFIYGHGGKGFQLGDDLKYTMPDAATVEALSKFKSLNNDQVMPKSVWTSGADPNALFKSGQVVAYFSGVWQVADFAESITNFEWVSAPTPAQPVHATDINTGGKMVAFNNGATAEAAKKWIDFIFQRDNYTKLSEVNGYLPVETGLALNYPFEQKAALDAFALYNKEIELADPISSSGQANGTKLNLAGKAIQDDPTKAEMAKFINGEQDVQKTVENIVNGLNSQVS